MQHSTYQRGLGGLAEACMPNTKQVRGIICRALTWVKLLGPSWMPCMW